MAATFTCTTEGSTREATRATGHKSSSLEAGSAAAFSPFFEAPLSACSSSGAHPAASKRSEARTVSSTLSGLLPIFVVVLVRTPSVVLPTPGLYVLSGRGLPALGLLQFLEGGIGLGDACALLFMVNSPLRSYRS